jgi:nucleoside-triphosphatase THEP1
MRTLYLVSAPRGFGKTSFCEALHANLTHFGLFPCSIVEKSERNAQGIPFCIELKNLETGERMVFAKRKAADNAGAYPSFLFDDSAFAWAGLKLTEAIAEARKPIILDEVGPLEIEYSKGFAPIVLELLNTFEGPLVLTIRPSLLEKFEKRFLNESAGEWNLEQVVFQGMEEAAYKAIQTAKSIFTIVSGSNELYIKK